MKDQQLKNFDFPVKGGGRRYKGCTHNIFYSLWAKIHVFGDVTLHSHTEQSKYYTATGDIANETAASTLNNYYHQMQTKLLHQLLYFSVAHFITISL